MEKLSEVPFYVCRWMDLRRIAKDFPKLSTRTGQNLLAQMIEWVLGVFVLFLFKQEPYVAQAGLNIVFFKWCSWSSWVVFLVFGCFSETRTHYAALFWISPWTENHRLTLNSRDLPAWASQVLGAAPNLVLQCQWTEPGLCACQASPLPKDPCIISWALSGSISCQ